MVVAAGAGDRHAEKRATRDVDLVVDDVVLELLSLFRIDPLRADCQETCGNQVPIVLGGIPGREQVAGNLFDDEPIVRLVFIQGVDDVIAIPPGVAVRNVALFAGRFAEADDVEPVPAPPLAETGRGQQPVDHIGDGALRECIHERVDFIGGGRQPREVESNTADESHAVGIDCGL